MSEKQENEKKQGLIVQLLKYRSALTLSSPVSMISSHTLPVLQHVENMKSITSSTASMAMVATNFFIPNSTRKQIMLAHTALQYAFGLTTQLSEKESITLFLKTVFSFAITLNMKHISKATSPFVPICLLTLHYARVLSDMLFISGNEHQLSQALRRFSGCFGFFLDQLSKEITNTGYSLVTKIIDTENEAKRFKHLNGIWMSKDMNLKDVNAKFEELDSSTLQTIERYGSYIPFDTQQNLAYIDFPFIMNSIIRYEV